MSTSKEKMNPIAPSSLKARAPGVAPAREDNRQSVSMPDNSKVGERGGVAAQQTGWAARQQAERLRARNAAQGSLQQDQHAGAEESPTGPAGKRQTDDARPKQHKTNSR